MAERTYESDELIIFWDSSRCIHTGNCLRAAPDVFDTEQRPWVNPAGASTDEIVAAIEQCPSGALRYRYRDGRPVEPKPEVTITPQPNGPLYVRGQVTVRTRSGAELRTDDRMTLCRCGASKNQPFCDLSHRDVGFRDNPNVVPEYRRSAEAPPQVEPPSG